jgi:cytochrome c peroxidase
VADRNTSTHTVEVFRGLRLLALCAAAIALALGAAPAQAQLGGGAIPPPDLVPLNQVPVPEPPSLFQYVKNKTAAIRLGKALFWDMQAGSDGVQACASCHFHAGADNRVKNTMNPGANGGDLTFQVRGPNQTLQPGDFPFHVRSQPELQESLVLRDANDVVGSQGVLRNDFVGVVPGQAFDLGVAQPDPVFQFGGLNARRVTGRNTPSNINAIFNFNNFWDGRAHFLFNGVNPFGPLDPTAGVWFFEGGALVKRPVAIQFGSLASQATGPVLDDTEMSYRGRTFPDVGRKLLSLTPLGQQVVHPGDSVLGPLSRAVLLPDGTTGGQNGLSWSYAQLIRDAFQDTFWSSPQLTPDGYTQMEANFSLYWGLAIQLYQATLVSDQTRYDRFLGGDQSAMTAEEQRGFDIFFGGGACAACHVGTEGTNASVRASLFLSNSSHLLIEQMAVLAGPSTIYDAGFNNTAVRPTTEDLGRGGTAPFTNPLTGLPFPLGFSELAKLDAARLLGFNTALFPANSPLTPNLPAQLPATFPTSNRGGFKVPQLRNVELTAPYFHNGGDLTLEEVVDFYARGGNFPALNANDVDAAFGDLGTLQGSPDKKAALVAFMKAMTDERVRNESAPFDHPELFVPNGMAPDGSTEFLRVPARDAAGSPVPTIAITIDPVASPTRLASQTVTGTKAPGATITLRVNGGAPAPVATGAGSTWSAQVTGLVEGGNTLAFTATDLAAGATTVTTSITLDTTAPLLTLGAVATPTALGTQVIGGTVEPGLLPVVLVFSGATAGPVSLLGNGWSATLTGLVPGVNGFAVTATDAAGNMAIQSASLVYRTADGDLDGAAGVGLGDAIRALRIAAGLQAAAAADLLRGDVAPLRAGIPSQDGAIDISDAQLILRKAAGLVNF